MQCAKFEQRLQRLLDERENIEQDATLREHAKTCAGCGGILRAQHRLFASLSAIPETGLARDFGPRVLDQLLIDRRQRNNKRIWLAALAVAAGILIVLLPLAGDRARLRDGEFGSGGGLALVTPARPQMPKRLTEQESEDIRMVMQQLVLRLSDQRLVMFEPVDRLASGIRPLTMTFNFAFDALRRTLPGYSPPQPARDPQALDRVDRKVVFG